MRELSLNELALVSGGKVPENAGGGFGLKTTTMVGGAAGFGGYAADVATGQKEWSMVDAAISTGGGALGGAGSTPYKAARSPVTVALIGSFSGKFITGTANQVRSAFGGSSQNNDNNMCKAGDDYNKK